MIEQKEDQKDVIIRILIDRILELEEMYDNQSEDVRCWRSQYFELKRKSGAIELPGEVNESSKAD